MNKQEAFYIIGNIPIPTDDENYDICQYQEAKAIALDCIQRVNDTEMEEIDIETFGDMMWDGGYAQGTADMQEFVERRCKELGIDYIAIFTCNSND